MHIKYDFQQYIDAGQNLFACKSDKSPIRKDWQTPTDAPLGDSAGWILDERHLVLDFDTYKEEGQATYEHYKETYDLPPPTVKTVRGGLHIYLTLPEGTVFACKNNTAPGLDIKTKGGYVIVAGSEVSFDKNGEHFEGTYDWADTLFGGFDTYPIPEKLLEHLKEKLTAPSEVIAVDDDSWIDQADFETTYERAKTYLDQLDPDTDHDNWIRYGMALSRCANFDGVALWKEWSATGSKYQEGECERRARSFKNNRAKPVTMGTLIKDSNDSKNKKTYDLLDNLKSKIKSISSRESLEDICSEVRKAHNFDSEYVDVLAKTLQPVWKEIYETPLKLADARHKVSKKAPKTKKQEADHTWTDNWVYLKQLSSYFNFEDRCAYSQGTFNQMCGKYIPANDKGNKPYASKYVADESLLNMAEKTVFYPLSEEPVVNISGHGHCVNTFNPSTVPSASFEYTEDGLETIRRIECHTRTICNNNEEDAHILTQWLAWQVQFMGHKNLFAPLIRSEQGIGKSFYGELLKQVIGDVNVRVVTPDDVRSGFNDWITNSCVVVLSELYIAGHNRYEIANKIKPLITDHKILVNRKYQPQHDVVNTANYFATTNRKDAIPLEDTDRRWWVIFVEHDTKEEFCEAATGEDPATYYRRLFNDGIHKHADQVRKWLLEYPITEKFKDMIQAPDTTYKQRMMLNEKSKRTGYLEAEELLKKGGRNFTWDVVSSADFFHAFALENDDIHLNNVEKANLLRQLGLDFHGTVKIEGKAMKIWTRRTFNNDQIRTVLSTTIHNNTLDTDNII